VRGRLSHPVLAELGEKLALDREEARLGEDAQDLGVQVRNHVDVGGVRAKGGTETRKRSDLITDGVEQQSIMYIVYK
jgi:hypothetical protein